MYVYVLRACSAQKHSLFMIMHICAHRNCTEYYISKQMDQWVCMDRCLQLDMIAWKVAKYLNRYCGLYSDPSFIALRLQPGVVAMGTAYE